MQKHSCLGWILMGAVGSMLAGCAAGRDVEVSGDVSAESTVRSEILLAFYEVPMAGEEVQQVHTATLTEPGSFRETVTVEGDFVRVVAIADLDGDGACSAGEPWAEVIPSIAEDDTVRPVSLALKDAPCPSTK